MCGEHIRSGGGKPHRDHAYSWPRSATESTHFSHCTALVWSGCLPPWHRRAASARHATRNQFMDKAMEHIHGPLRKMIATAESPVSYRLPIGEVELPLNAFLGKTICLDSTGAI